MSLACQQGKVGWLLWGCLLRHPSRKCLYGVLSPWGVLALLRLSPRTLGVISTRHVACCSLPCAITTSILAAWHVVRPCSICLSCLSCRSLHSPHVLRHFLPSKHSCLSTFLPPASLAHQSWHNAKAETQAPASHGVQCLCTTPVTCLLMAPALRLRCPICSLYLLFFPVPTMGDEDIAGEA